jgi:hypothetical protein
LGLVHVTRLRLPSTVAGRSSAKSATNTGRLPRKGKKRGIVASRKIKRTRQGCENVAGQRSPNPKRGGGCTWGQSPSATNLAQCIVGNPASPGRRPLRHRLAFFARRHRLVLMRSASLGQRTLCRHSAVLHAERIQAGCTRNLSDEWSQGIERMTAYPETFGCGLRFCTNETKPPGNIHPSWTVTSRPGSALT